MPVKIRRLKSGKYKVSTPGGTKAKSTSLKNAKSQEKLINAVEHGWKPTGMPAGKHMMPNGKMMGPVPPRKA